MRAVCNRDSLLAALGAVSGVTPLRSPKPILQNVKFVVDDVRGSTVMATDLEVGIRARVLGVVAEDPGAVILPTARTMSILRTSTDPELAITSDDERLLIRGKNSEFTLPLEDVELFPELPDFAAPSYQEILASELKKLVRRTMFATDTESTRYALGGVLFEFGRETLALVGTDGRRLARMIAPVHYENDPTPPAGSPVVPVKALKLLERNLLADDSMVQMVVQMGMSILLRTESAVIYSRLVEGRFPRYQDVFPASVDIKIPLEVGPLRVAIEQAAIITSEESRGVDFRFEPGVLQLLTRVADVGSSHVELPIQYDGKPVQITFDPRYLIDALKTLDDGSIITAELIDAKNAAVFRTEDQYTYVVMPLTREQA